jgi:hypothetical protein
VSIRAANSLLVFVALGVVAAVLYLGGCFERRISAPRTAALLRASSPAARSVTCSEGSHGWDYTCIIRFADKPPLVIDVDVNGHTIVSQSAP